MRNHYYDSDLKYQCFQQMIGGVVVVVVVGIVHETRVDHVHQYFDDNFHLNYNRFRNNL